MAGCIFTRLLILTLGATASSAQRLDVFLDKWVQAVEHRDPAGYRSLIHPTSKACLVGENRDFLTRLVQTRLNTSIHEPPQISLTPIARSNSNNQLFNNQVQPTHVAAINIGRQTIAIGVAVRNNQWLEVMPCPNSNGLKLLRLQWGISDRFTPIAAVHNFLQSTAVR